MPKPCVHFVGFKDPRISKDERYWRAVQIFGEPDFLHPGWDLRARREIDFDCDTIVFAKGDWRQEPRVRPYDDSPFM